MEKTVHLFNTEQAFKNTYYSEDYSEPWVSSVKNTETVKFNKTDIEKFRPLSKDLPLTFEAIEDNTNLYFLCENRSEEGNPVNIYYYDEDEEYWIEVVPQQNVWSLDYDENWDPVFEFNAQPFITLSAGESIQLYGDSGYISTGGGSQYDDTFGSYFYTDKKCYIYGNVMSLCSFDFEDYNTITDYGFYGLFGGTFIMDIEGNLSETANRYCPFISHPLYDIVLPATTLGEACYYGMFYGTEITRPPELPALQLQIECYAHMFSNCKRLMSAPELPATTLQNRCYSCMFMDCVSLTKAPDLLATNIALLTQPYSGMFRNCIELNYIKCIASALGDQYKATVSNWVNSVGAHGTFVKNSACTWDTGVSGIPSGWTVIEETV